MSYPVVESASPSTLGTFSTPVHGGQPGAQRGHVADDSRHGPRRRAAGRGDAEAVVDGDRRVDFATLRGMVDDAARALLASGIERGDRVAVWAPNSLEWIVAALGVTTAGGVLVPINTRFRGAEAAYVLARSGARALFTVRGFLDTDYPALLASAGVALPALEHTILLAGEPDGASIGWDDFLARGRAVADADLDARVASIGARRSERRRVHVGHDREPEGRRDDARPDAARVPRLVRLGRPAPRRPLPHREPVLPHLRLQGRLPRVPHARRDDLPARGVRRRGRARDRRARADLGAPGPADDLPLAARPSRPHAPRHLEPARRRHRRGRHPRRAHPARPRRAAVRAHPHRLRAHRSRHGHRLPARRRLRAHRDDRRCRRGPASRCAP